jgi:predicted HTH domain antitoxin
MKNISIPVDISPEIMIALNENEKELKDYFQSGIAIMLFQEGKLTFGKAVQLSGLTRYEFEKALTKKNIPFSHTNIEQVFSDVEKLSDL